MATETPAPPGILESFRTLGDSLLASAHDRVTLVSLELQEEKLRLIHIAFWVGAIVFTSMMAVTFASLVLVYLFWENARLAVLGGLAVSDGTRSVAAFKGRVKLTGCIVERPVVKTSAGFICPLMGMRP